MTYTGVSDQGHLHRIKFNKPASEKLVVRVVISVTNSVLIAL